MFSVLGEELVNSPLPNKTEGSKAPCLLLLNEVRCS